VGNTELLNVLLKSKL